LGIAPSLSVDFYKNSTSWLLAIKTLILVVFMQMLFSGKSSDQKAGMLAQAVLIVEP
jgi:hypothetical protein